MKRLLPFIILVLYILCVSFVYNFSDEKYKVFKLDSPVKIYLDLNKNFIFDEREPFIVHGVYFIDENRDYSNDKILKNLSDDEKFYLSYKANKFADILLNNKFVKIENKEIIIGGKKYIDMLTESSFFYSDNDDSKRKIVEKVKSLNVSDYVIYNYKTKKAHKLSCTKGRKSKKFYIIKRDEVPSESSFCPFCYKSEDKKEKTSSARESSELQSKNIVTPKNDFKNTVFVSENIKIYYIQLNDIFKPSSSCSNVACSDLKNEIDNAKETIDMSIYGIDKQPQIINSIIAAQKRGVKVRWVFDHDKNGENYYKDTLSLKKYITDFNTDEEYEKRNRSSIMHNKFFIFDNKKVWTGSANITNTDLSGFNANFAVLINNSELAKVYAREFEQMFNGKFHSDKNIIDKNVIKINKNTHVLPLFSPADNIIDDYLIKEINNAKHYIYIPVFFITYKNLITPLINAHKRGVEIKIIDDATNAHNKYSIHKILRENGIKVKTENYAGKIHMKTMIIDDYTSVIGSMNFTKSATKYNDENVLIIKGEQTAKYLKSSFSDIWNKIPEKYEKFDPYAESVYSIGSCTDGADNDFDGKIDAADEGCSSIKKQ